MPTSSDSDAAEPKSRMRNKASGRIGSAAVRRSNE
jgi:hypothetical protein